tara:strand:+ start:2140 stop:3381 length:1242 start_codon:yes stop_codon:yes gene_type:complete
MHPHESTRLYVFLLLIFSLFFSSYIGENSSGGAKLDSIITRQFIDGFLVSFDYGINYFIKTNQVLSPFFFFLMSFLEKILGQFFLKYLYVLISSLIPLIFYISLKKKFKGVNKNILFFISLIVFLSPYFRSSSSWITSDNLATLFFILSISKFLDLERKKNFKNLFLCSFYLILATYVRQYYAIFFPLYFILTYRILNKKEIFFLITLISIYFIPIFFYYYNFFSLNADSQNKEFTKLLNQNFFYSGLVFLSLYFFYLFPFYLNKNLKNNIFYFINKKIFLFIFISIFFIFIGFFDPIVHRLYGGGMFIKLSQIFNNNNILYFVSYLGSLFLFINLNKNNFFIYLGLIIMFPFITIYQKYYDPLLLIVLLTLTKNGSFHNMLIKNNLNLKIVFIYYLIFLVLMNFYFINIINV